MEKKLSLKELVKKFTELRKEVAQEERELTEEMNEYSQEREALPTHIIAKQAILDYKCKKLADLAAEIGRKNQNK